MTRRLSTIALGVVMWTALVAAGHHHLRHEFYIYDTSTKDFICGAVVTVSYEGGSQTAETRTNRGECGGVTFLIPGEPYLGYATIEADGYVTDYRTIVLGQRPHVGGKAFYIGLEPALR